MWEFTLDGELARVIAPALGLENAGSICEPKRILHVGFGNGEWAYELGKSTVFDGLLISYSFSNISRSSQF